MAQLIYRAIRHGVKHMNIGAEAFEWRLRERTLRTVKNLISTHEISETELKSMLVLTNKL